MPEPVYAIGLVAPVLGPAGDDFPAGIAITSIVGRAFSLDETAAFVLSLHRTMAGGTKPLEVHWPEAGSGWRWALTPVAGDETEQERNYRERRPPFQAFSRPEMERYIAIFDSEADLTPSFRSVTYPMNVTQVSASGLRFKVNDAPAMWVLAAQTQGGV